MNRHFTTAVACLSLCGDPAIPGALVGQELPRATLHEELRIPGDGPKYSISRIAGLVEGPGGGVAALLPMEQCLILFSGTGQFVRQIGRAGSGPGEFDRPRALGVHGDSLWVWDLALARISVFAGSGEFIRSVPMVVSGAGVLLRTGDVAVVPPPRFNVTGDGKEQLTIKSYSVAGALRRTILDAQTHHSTLRYIRGNGAVVGMQPFDDGEILAAGPDGSILAVIERGVTRLKSPRFRVTAVNERGDTLYRRSFPYSPVRLKSSDIKAAIAPLLTGPDSADPTLPGRIEEALYRPAHLPTVTGAVLGQDRTLWLRRESQGGATVRWTVLSPRGLPVYELVHKADSAILAVNKDRVWCVELDADGVPQIVRYRVVVGR